MSFTPRNQITAEEAVDSSWRNLYKIAGAAILISLAMIPLSILGYIAWPPPNTALESFRLFQDNPVAGLVSLDLLYLVSNILSIPVFLALYAALRRTAQSTMTLATALGLVGILAIFSARPMIEMLSLSQQYATAATDVQRAMYLAAGEALLTHFEGTAFQLHYFLGSVALLIISVVMLRGGVFSKTTAHAGIAANVLVFGLYVPKIGVFLSILSVFPFFAIWYILIARRLFQLAGGRGGKPVVQEAA